MSSNPFKKSLSAVGFTDIQNLKDNAIAESKFLDYKQEMPTKIDLQKEVLGFANNAGGYLVIGIREKKPEGIPEAIVGIAKEGNLKERIVATIRDNSIPLFIPQIHLIDLPSDSTKCVIVVHSHESTEAHKASDGNYYYRTGNQTIPIRPEFVAKIVGKEKVQEQIKKAIEAVHPKIAPEGSGINVGNNTWLGIICCPIPPESVSLPIFSETEWYDAAGRDALASSGSFDRKSSADSFKVLQGSISTPTGVVEYFESGLILSCYNLHTDKVHEDLLRNKLARFLDLVKKVYDKNAFSGGVLLIVGLGNIGGRKWTTGNPMKDMMMDIEASQTPYLELRLETAIFAMTPDTNNVAQQIMTKWQRHFNIH